MLSPSESFIYDYLVDVLYFLRIHAENAQSLFLLGSKKVKRFLPDTFIRVRQFSTQIPRNYKNLVSTMH